MKKQCGTFAVCLVLVAASLCGPAEASWAGWKQFLLVVGAPAGSLPGLCFPTFGFEVPPGQDPGDTLVWATYSALSHMHNADAIHSCPQGLGGTYNEVFRAFELDHIAEGIWRPYNLEVYLPPFGCPGGLVFLQAKAQGADTNGNIAMIWGGDNSYRVYTSVSRDTGAWSDYIPLPDDRYRRPLSLKLDVNRIDPEIRVCNVAFPVLEIHYTAVPGVAGIVYNSGGTNRYSRLADEVELGDYIVNSTGSGQDAVVYYAYAYLEGDGSEIIDISQKTVSLPPHGWDWGGFDSRPASDFPPGPVLVYFAVKHNGVLRQLGTPTCFEVY